jgi:hypothetical protein
MSNFLNKIPVSPITSFGNPSVPNGSTIGTNFSILQTGGFMEVYTLSGLTYTIPPATTGIIEFSGNSIPIQFTKGSGSVFSPDVLTLNSDNISSGRRKLGMLVYVYETNKIYQFRIDNYDTLWGNATGATGPGGPTVVISDFGTTVKNNSVAGQSFINAWTASTISGVGGYDDTNASWRVLSTGGSSGGAFTGGTVTGATIFTDGLTANTFSAETYYNLPVSGVTGGTGISASSLNGLVTIVNTAPDQIITLSGGTGIQTGGTYPNFVITNTAPDQTVTITGGTNIEIDGTYPNFGVSVTGVTELFDNYLPLSGGTVTGATIFTSGLTANTFSLSTTPNTNTTNTDVLTLNQSTGIIEQRSINSLINVVNLVTVGLTGSTGVDFYSVKDAVDSITGASDTNTFVVKVGPGVFYEDPITMKSYVDVIGESETNTIIQANDPNTSLITGADQSMISDVQIQGCTGTSVAAVVYSSPTTPQLNAIFYVENVRFGANYTHAKTVGTSGGNCIMQCSNVKYGGYPFTLGFYVTNDGSGVGRMQLRNVTSTNGGVTTTSGLIFAKADQPGCAFIVNGCLLTKATGAAAGTGFWVENGGSLRLTAVNFQRWETAIYAPQIGSAPSIDAIALNFENCTTDVNIIHSGATGKIQGTDSYVKTLINIDAPLYEVNQDPRIITVDKKGGDFTSIKSAVDSITGSSSNNRFLVSVGPGRFTEGLIDLTGKPYISVEGSNIITTEVVPISNTQHIFKIGQNNELSFLSLSGASSGYAGIYAYDIGDYGQAHKLSFTDCDTNIWIESNTQDTTFFGEYIDFNGDYSYGVKIIANNGYVALANMENYYNFPTGTGTTIANSIQGSGATLSVFVGDGIGNGNSGSTNYQIADYASLNTISTTSYNWGYSVRVLNNGGPSRFDIDSLSIVDSIVYDLSIEHPGTFGTFGGGSASHAKINNLSDDVYWAFLDIEDGEFDITRKISITFQDDTHTDASTLIFKGGTMGLMSGGTISIVSGLTVNVSSGFGYLQKTTPEEVYMRIDWVSSNITLPQNVNYYLYYNENEILSTSGSKPDSVNNILLGRVVTNSSTVSFIDGSPLNSDHTSNRFDSLFREALGPIYAFGSIVTEGTTPFTLDVTAGEYYYSTNEYQPTGGSGLTFNQYYRDGLGGWNISATTLVNNTQFDNNGTLSGLTSSAYTKHTLYIVGDGVNEKYFLVLGQNQYQTLVETENALLPEPPSYFTDAVTQIANIYIKQGLSGITEIEDIRPVIGFKAGGINASSLHANLLGLSSDDHKQYLLVDGSRAMSNNLNMGGNAITSASTYNGVTIESHASRHQNGGADEISTSTPSASAIPKADTFGKLDGWISDASSTVKGLTRLSVNPLSATIPIAVGVNDPRFLSSISGVTNTTPSLVFTNNSGGTTTISNLRMTSISATTISATTYQNLPIDIRVTGGTYSASTGITTFVNNTGGTFTVSGYYTPSDDIYVSGGTIGNGPDTADNKITLNRTDGNSVTLLDLVDIVNLTKSDMDTIIGAEKVIRGKTYKISNCDTSLYNNGTDSNSADVYTTIYLLGLKNNKLSESGIGIFYTPKYNDYEIFVDGKPFFTNDNVIWGGFVWILKGGDGPYNSIDIFTLPNEFEKRFPFEADDQYNKDYYIEQYDDIIYDYTNDRIIYRNEENSNIVSTTYENINYWITTKGYYNPIRVFQWGHLVNSLSVGVIYNQQIINSYNENINYRGEYQKDFYFNNLSYQRDFYVELDSYQSNFIFDNQSYQNDITITNTSYQSGITLNNNSYQNRIIIDESSYQNQITLNNNSYQDRIDIFGYPGYPANQSYFNFKNGSYHFDILLESGSGKPAIQNYFNFNNNSYQDNINLINDTQLRLDFTNNSGQSNFGGTSQDSLIFDSSTQINGTNISQQNITIKNYNRDLTSVTGGEQDRFFIHDLPTDNTASVYIGKINNQLVQVTKPTDIFVTGGTYSGSTIIFRNNSGGTFNVTGITTSSAFTGGTVTGATSFTGGLTANTISATTYQNLPTDVRVTGATYSNNTFTYTNNTGGTFNVLFNTVTGLTVNGNLTVTGTTTSTTISATTYQNLPTDVFVTGGTYSNGTATFTNNTGGTFNVTGLYTGGTDVFVTGATKSGDVATFTNNTGGTFTLTGLTDTFVTGGTYSGSTIIFTNSSGGTFDVTGITTSSAFTGGTVSGATIFTGGLTADTISATTITSPSISSYGLIVATSIGYQNIF